MRSARKLRRQQRRSRAFSLPTFHVGKKGIVFTFGVLAILTSVFVVIFLTGNRIWDGKKKMSVAVPTSDGAAVILFDPQYEEVVTIYIPKSTEVEVARSLGVWKVESLWQLGVQEKVEGKLMSDTFTKFFRFPTIAWADTPFLGLASGSVSDLYKGVFSVYHTNVSIFDRISMAWFSFNVSNANRTEIHLEDTGYLKATTLSDGSRGYKKQDPPPQRILSLFSDTQMAKSAYSVSLIDATGGTNSASDVGKVVEVLGAKIARLKDEAPQDIDCIVTGKDLLLIKNVAEVFACDTKEDSNASFDLEIILGSQFVKRF